MTSLKGLCFPHLRMAAEIDLGVWCRRLVLVALLMAAVIVALKIGVTFWGGYSLGTAYYYEADKTVTECAKRGDSTKHFRRTCEEAALELAKAPVIFAIEHAWEKLWPCESTLCTEAVVYVTKSIWTVFAISALLSLILLYFTGCGGRTAAGVGPQVMWAPQTPYCHPAHLQKERQCIIDVTALKKEH